MFTCSTLLLFPYPVPADIHGSVQHVNLESVRVDVLPRLFLLFSQVNHFECHHISPPQEVQCVHMYSMAWDVPVICANHYLTETRWKLCMYGGSWRGEAGGSCEKSCGGLWPRCVDGCVRGSCDHQRILPVRHPHVTHTNMCLSNHLNLFVYFMATLYP